LIYGPPLAAARSRLPLRTARPTVDGMSTPPRTRLSRAMNSKKTED